MIDQLFGSKTRVKLLTLFYNNLDRPYYVREITRIIDEQINSVRRELQNLLSIGMVKSVSQGNRLYYEINDEFTFHKQFMSIFNNLDSEQSVQIKSEENKLEDKIATIAKNSGQVSLLLLSGSFVRNSENRIDIFIVGDIVKSKFSNNITKVEADLKRELNYTIMSNDDFTYRRNINDKFLQGLINANKKVLIDEIDLFPEEKKEVVEDKQSTDKLVAKETEAETKAEEVDDLDIFVSKPKDE